MENPRDERHLDDGDCSRGIALKLINYNLRGEVSLILAIKDRKRKDEGDDR
jgi:hypothetical protein